MDVIFHHDLLPHAMPVYECARSAEVLTYDWQALAWRDAKTLEDGMRPNRTKCLDRCQGDLLIGGFRPAVYLVSKAVGQLLESGKDGCVLLSWYHRGPQELAISLIWSSEAFFSMDPEKTGSWQIWPDWFPVHPVSAESLVVVEIMHM